jgi:hypothetical protein
MWEEQKSDPLASAARDISWYLVICNNLHTARVYDTVMQSNHKRQVYKPLRRNQNSMEVCLFQLLAQGITRLEKY